MAKASDEFTIFYAWQSDTPGAGNRYLIEEALDEACAGLRADGATPYGISVTKDTAGVPGLCDIPAAILEKIEAADAVVLDLTFIAQTAGTPTKFCPNPNVLFELGFAFHAAGPERLVCVMNENFGPGAGLLFDIAHRRRPIDYKYPLPSKTRADVVTALARELATALKPIVELGPRSLGIDDAVEHDRDAAEIRTHWLSKQPQGPQPSLFFSIRPKRYQKRRWPDVDSLLNLVQSRQVPGLHRAFPPSSTQTDAMQWGLYNPAYGRPYWGMTYSGQFWAAYNIRSPVAYPPDGNYVNGGAENHDDLRRVGAGGWIDYTYTFEFIAEMFRFAASLCGAFSPKEIVNWACGAEDIAGQRLASSDSALSHEVSRECAAQYARSIGELKAEEFTQDWREQCADFCHEFFSRFEIYGERISRQTVVKHINLMHPQKAARPPVS